MQTWQAVLKVTQECDKDMTEEEFKAWIEQHFAACDYGHVEVVDVVQTDWKPKTDDD